MAKASVPNIINHRWRSRLLSPRFTDILLVVSLCGNAYVFYLLLPHSQSMADPSPLLRNLYQFGSSAYSAVVGSTHEGSGLDPAWEPHSNEFALVESSTRLLADANNTNSSESHSSHGGHHGPHQHDALVFLFNCILLGTGLFHLSSVYPKLQLSIALFVGGIVLSLIFEGLNFKEHSGVWGESYIMWMNIDPHLLLFTMLPTLLAGDAMTIDTSVARRVGQQCVFLAGPGVLASAMLTALFLQVYLDWEFLLSLVTGSILCATDPVAVVALLKELGASPTLTVQIQGESLLNDGTAIVLYTIAYNMLSGEKYDAADMAMFLVKVAIMGLAFGVFTGYFFFTWIRAAGNRFNHAFPIIQILLTLLAAYWSFVLSEGVFHMSGVLATVGSSIVLAHHMWPYVVDREALIDFWHAVENLGNIIIFVLGGALVGAAMVHIEWVDYGNLLVIYLFLTILRGAVLFSCRPLLQLLHKDRAKVSIPDALVMTWGGLRGAVGLALAIQVQRGRAEDEDGNHRVDEDTANRVLFFVAGTAFLTIVVNASTCPLLVDYLGITALPEAESRLLEKFNEQLVHFSMSQDNPVEVTDRLNEILEHTAHELAHNKRQRVGRMATNLPAVKYQGNDMLIAEHKRLAKQYAEVDAEEREQLPQEPDDMNGNIGRVIEMLGKFECDVEVMKAVNKTFLSVVDTHYWQQMQEGDLKPGSDEATLLFTSLRNSIDAYQVDLTDYKYLEGLLQRKKKKHIARMTLIAVQAEKTGFEGMLARFVNSSYFNTASAIAILTNVIYVAIEEAVRGVSDSDSAAWLVFEAIFTFIFFMEFVLKFAHLRLAYFKDAWNLFDFFLVILGIVGLVLTIVAHGDSNADAAREGSSETRVIRIARVLRTMRFLRFFRLLHARMSADNLVSQDLQRRIKELNTLSSFVRGHMASQKKLLKYFAGDIDEKNEVEMARCVLQSQVQVYKAALATVEVQSEMDSNLVHELQHVTMRKHVVETLEHFVENALKDGAINEKNAHSLLHPLHHEISECLSQLDRRREGVMSVKKPDTDMSHLKKSQTRLGLLESAVMSNDLSPVARIGHGVYGQEGDMAAGGMPTIKPETPTATLGKPTTLARSEEEEQASDASDNDDSAANSMRKKKVVVRKKKVIVSKELDSNQASSALPDEGVEAGIAESGSRA